MRRRTSSFLLSVLISTALVLPANAAPWINEFSYDTAATNDNNSEFIEIAGSTSLNLSEYSIVLYNGANGQQYDTRSFSGSWQNVVNGIGFASIVYPNVTNGIFQNGSPDGMALVRTVGSTTSVVQFLSYEGVMTALNGPANGVTSTDVGVSQTNTTPAPVAGRVQSLNLTGTGSAAADFIWQGPSSARLSTPGAVNEGQTISGTAPPPPPPPPPPTDLVTIMQIQGASHTSPLAGQTRTTSGIVTAVAGNGFYIQDATGDGNDATSDGLFVFTGSSLPSSLAVGDSVQVRGAISEFLPGGAASNLTITQLALSTGGLTTVSTGNTLPGAIIGSGGRVPPTSRIDSDQLGTFNPSVDGIDFYESLEGMRVTVRNTQAVSASNNFEEVWVVADRGVGATGINSRGGITIGATDYNPERLQIDDELSRAGVNLTGASVGDRLGDVTGVISYGFTNYELLATSSPTITSGAPDREITSIAAGGSRLTVASYNVENLSTANTDAATRFATFAGHVVTNLRSPDIIGLQEIQDDSGNADNGVTTGQATGQRMINAILAAGGPRYVYREVDPGNNVDSGGGGNIRVAYLVRDDRGITIKDVRQVPGSQTANASNPFNAFNGDPQTINGQTFDFSRTRKPLELVIDFQGNEVVLINNHLTSKVGSRGLFGAGQLADPLETELFNTRLTQRTLQTVFLNNYVSSLLGANPSANILVLGDLNELYFLSPIRQLLAGADGLAELFDLSALLPNSERFSFNFEGNSQLLDYIMASGSLLALDALFDIVHINSGYASRFSDHDPVLASFALRSIPTPPTLAMFGVGLAALAWAARRRRSTKAAQA
jgi:predicted extracellular nuclease